MVYLTILIAISAVVPALAAPYAASESDVLEARGGRPPAAIVKPVRCVTVSIHGQIVLTKIRIAGQPWRRRSRYQKRALQTFI